MKPATLYCGTAMIVILVGSMPTTADVPPRSAGGQTLVIPPAELEGGEVYHITPGGDTQLIFQSETPLRRVAAVCNRVVGYVITPFDIEDAPVPILGGAFRIPVASLRTGLPKLDTELHSEAALHKAAHPEITGRLASVSNVKLLSTEDGRRSYSLTAAGELHVKDQTAEVSASVKVLFVPFTWGTMNRNMGDLMIVRTRFDAQLADLGLKPPENGAADTATIDLFLMCSTVSPEKTFDPRIQREQHLKQLQFLTLLRDFDNPEQAYAFGREFTKTIWNDGPALNRLAWAALTEDGVETRDLRFVERVVTRANDVTKGQDAEVLATLARLCYERQQYEDAVRWAKRATERLEGLAGYVAAPIRAALAEYESRLNKENATVESEDTAP